MDDRTASPERMVPRRAPDDGGGGMPFGGHEPLKRPQDAVPPRAEPEPPPQRNATPIEEESDERDRTFETTATGEPPLPPEEGPLEYYLSKPIEAHGERVEHLKWREPTGLDIERAGNPIIMEMNSEGRAIVTFNEKKMAAMISLLAKIPPHSVQSMTAGDWNGIAWKLVQFFMPVRVR